MNRRPEPTDLPAVAAFVAAVHGEHDPFGHVFAASEEHRQAHGADCKVYPTSSGRLLGGLARVLGAKRVLEVGCGLGYSALWLAWGSAPDGRVETIEKDEEHARLARAHFEEAGVGDRIKVLLGPAHQVLPDLSDPYDFIFVDSDWADYPVLLPHLVRVLRQGGLLASSNLWPATYAPGLNGLPEVAEYRRQLMEEPALFTTFLTGGPALSLKVVG